jgi:hypothetical protein
LKEKFQDEFMDLVSTQEPENGEFEPMRNSHIYSKNAKRLMWASHAWRKKDAMINVVIKEEPKKKRPLGRPNLRREDCVKERSQSSRLRSKLERSSLRQNKMWREIYYTRWLVEHDCVRLSFLVT